ncbi:MAG: TetR family transcriptional regulator [Acidimicrobiales bacterium]|nr:TetR family transcriptional regulator [Acidimicrobiales bacterium]
MDETRHRTNRHAGLEPDEVLDRALTLVEVEGADALTMRRLASELGVATTSIYWHVGNREQLVTAMVRRHGLRLAEAPIVGDTPRQRVLAVARLIWEGALANREVTRLASAHGLSSLHAQRLELAMARELQEAGVVGESARDALRAITACVGGFIIAALLDDALPTDHRRSSVLAHLEDPGLDPATHSALATNSHLPSLFDTTLRTVVDSLVPADLSANAYL